MQTVREQPGLVHWDRLVSLERVTKKGGVVLRGSTGGMNVVRIHRGSNGLFITAHCIMQELLCANIRAWPSAVSEDGCTITLWLIDSSLGRQPYKRQFHLTFFHETSASLFFESFVSELEEAGLSFDVMKSGVDEEDESAETIDLLAEEEEHQAADKGNDDDEGGEQEVENDNGRGDGDETATQEEIDDLNFLLRQEAEAPWGESQDLFNPIHPFE